MLKLERLLHLYADTWIIHLHRHGILMVSFLPLGTKIKHAAFGMFGIFQSLLLFLRGTLGAIRSIRSTSDGPGIWQWAEPADFVHVYDAKQEI
uniref:Uncharacterized protein n=1 Tax=Medicago truncatula TaxID=3880 RepID=I3S9W3_MEDTR|nr:unknown [Medicago truncatula]